MKKINEQKLKFEKKTVTVLTNLKSIVGGKDKDPQNTNTIELTINTNGGSSGLCRND